MCKYIAENGCMHDWHLMHLGQFAVSGAGLVMTEMTDVEPEGRIGPYCVGLYSDECEIAMRRVALAPLFTPPPPTNYLAGLATRPYLEDPLARALGLRAFLDPIPQKR